MDNINNILVIGNDKRLVYVKKAFFERGINVIEDFDDIDSETIVCFGPPSEIELLTENLAYLKKAGIVFLGAVNEECRLFLSQNDIRFYDYLSSKEVIEENARLTASGIISIAQREGAVLENSDCLVLGYGHCGKNITKALLDLGAKVDVAARRHKQKEDIEAFGASYVDIGNLEKSRLFKYSYIFNSVPALVLRKEHIDRLSKNIIIFDIASKPGGVDLEYCNKLGIKASLILGIPGKMYPYEAGKIISNAIIEYINAI